MSRAAKDRNGFSVLSCRAFRAEDVFALADDVIGGAAGERLDGEGGVGGSLSRHDAAVANKEIVDVVSAAELIGDARAVIAADAGGADKWA
jgi:hypothetical protein